MYDKIHYKTKQNKNNKKNKDPETLITSYKLSFTEKLKMFKT